jgi:hypothetical protein
MIRGMTGIALVIVAIVLASAGTMLHGDSDSPHVRTVGVLMIGLAMCLCIEAGRQVA